MNKLISGKTTSSLVTKIIQCNLRNKLEKIVKKLAYEEFDEPPMAALVDITSRCNLNCRWCIDRYCLSNIEIATERILRLLDEFKTIGVRSIVYFGGGEPLLHPGLASILEKTHTLGIDYAINTNGILLDRYIDIIAKTCSWCRISLDAGSDEVYRKIHEGKNNFQEIITNIKKLANCARGTVGISYVVMKENICNMERASILAKENNCEFIQFKPEYKPLISNERKVKYYTKRDSQEIKNMIVKAKKNENEQFAVLTTGSLDTLINFKPINQNKNYSRCFAQQIIPLINPHGVYVCPNWRGAKNKSIGDINTQAFMEIWKSERRRKIVSTLNPAKECNLNCLRHQTNVLFDALVRSEKMNFHLLDYLKEIDGDSLSDKYFL